MERDALHELGNAFWLAVSVVLIAALGKRLLPDDWSAAPLVFALVVVAYVAVLRIRLWRNRVRSTVRVRLSGDTLSQTSADPVLAGEVDLASAVLHPPGQHAGESLVVVRDASGGVVRIPERILDASPEVASVVRRLPGLDRSR